MIDENTKLPAIPLSTSDVPAQVIEITNAISSGKIKNAKMEWDGEKKSLTFTADSPDGEDRFTITKSHNNGLTRETKEYITRPSSIEERLDRVEQLYKEKLTQNQIAERTMTSQKTVSNDIKKLKEAGRIK